MALMNDYLINRAENDSIILEAFPKWNSELTYAVGDAVFYNNVLYKCVQGHTSQTDWNPEDAVSLWAEMLNAPTEDGSIPEWVQPGSTNPYMTGDKVTFNGKVYESLIDNNVWSPEAYPAGWREVS